MFVLPVDEDLHLELVYPRHVAAIHALIERARPRLAPWLPFAAMPSGEEATRQFVSSSLEKFGRMAGLDVVMVYRGEIAGVAGFANLRPERSAEIGYWVGEGFEGRGIVLRTTATLTDLAFREHKVVRVQIRCDVENLRSRRVPERLLFVQEGVLRGVEFRGEEPRDMVYYSLLRLEWEQRGGRTMGG